jgi:beta-galactosidase
VLKACDSLGLLASVEIPIVNEITQSENFYLNSEQMLVEMIRQNFNHPSVIMWCYMNEVLLKQHFTGNAEKQKKYISNITTLAQRLEDLTRKEDPFRYTMMANHGNYAQYKNAGLLQIPMIVGWNLYSGWYGGTMEDFPKFLDKFHNEFPAKPIMVTEYGADADPRIRSAKPVRFDKSIEYTTIFHQYYFKEIMMRKFVAGAVVWSLADFNSETRAETMPHINNKGLMQWDRTPKDPYYFYKAVLSKSPFIKILGSCENKFGIADSTSNFCCQPIQIASNLDSVSVTLNGILQTKQKVVDELCEWKLHFKEGSNIIIAKGKKGRQNFSDTTRTQFHLQSPCLTSRQIPFKEMNIMLGSSRYFIDGTGHWWQPDQCYRKGGWGSVGGEKFQLQNNSRLPYGTDKNIAGTEDDPIYQTQITGIKQYRFDVPPGHYQISFHFAELTGGKTNLLPYNLSEEDSAEQIKKRVFNVSVNGRVTLDHFNIAEEYGLAKAVVKSTTVTVNNDEGISVDFSPINGEPVLNALQLKKLD